MELHCALAMVARKEEPLKEACERINKETGAQTFPIAADIRKAQDCEKIIKTSLSEMGCIDILINNAGNAGSDPWPDMKSFVDTSPEDWAPYFAVNLFGMMHCVHAVLPQMIERKWGRIVTILSDASRVGEPKLAAYAGAKAGAAGVARSVASDTARYGITVNNISLGTMRTPLTESYWASLDENQLSQRMSTYPIRRPGVPDDVAALVGYLVSPQSEWMTGQTIPLNGGYSMAL